MDLKELYRQNQQWLEEQKLAQERKKAEENSREVSLLDVLIEKSCVRDKKELMKISIASEKGGLATDIITQYLMATKQEYRLKPAPGSKNLAIYKKNEFGFFDEIVEIINIGIKDANPPCYKPIDLENTGPNRKEIIEDEQTLQTRTVWSYDKGTRSKPSRHKFSELWAVLGRYYIDMSIRLPKKEFDVPDAKTV